MAKRSTSRSDTAPKTESAPAAQPDPAQDTAASPPTDLTEGQTTPPPNQAPATSTTTTYDFATGQPMNVSQGTENNPGSGQQTEAVETAEAAEQQAEVDAKLFTQEELESIIKDRLDRQRRRYQQLAKGQGQATEEAESQEAETSTEQPAPPDNNAELEAIQSQLADVGAEVKQARIATAIAVESQRQGIDAGLAAKLIEDSNVEFENGQPTTESVQAALNSLVAQYPNLRTMPPLTASNPARSGQAVRNDSDRWQDYFGGGNSPFWHGGGVSTNE